MPARLTSRSNPLVKRARLLSAEPEARKREGAFIVEGVRLLEEALEARTPIEHVLHSPRLAVAERGRRMLETLARARVAAVGVSDAVIDAISDAETSQGVLAIVRTTASTSIPERAASAGFWVVGWGLQDPGNLGTLMRSADAAGADLFMTVAGTADPTSPKAVRASAGSIFRLPLARGIPPDDILDAAYARGIRLFGTAPAGGVPYDTADYPAGIGFVFGREGEGLPPAVSARLHGTVSIPMRAGVESLNVAAAAAVVLFEVARRRRQEARTP